MKMKKTDGQIAYEEDVRRKPIYENGKPRKTWDQLDNLEKLSWITNPTPREWKK
jgi:hypothetical protein